MPNVRVVTVFHRSVFVKEATASRSCASFGEVCVCVCVCVCSRVSTKGVEFLAGIFQEPSLFDDSWVVRFCKFTRWRSVVELAPDGSCGPPLPMTPSFSTTFCSGKTFTHSTQSRSHNTKRKHLQLLPTRENPTNVLSERFP